MKNDEIGRALERELAGVRLSSKSRALIKQRTASRRRAALRARTIAAAAVALALGCAAIIGFINRPDTPDVTVAAHGSGSAPATVAPAAKAPVRTIMGMWIAEGDAYFHSQQICAMRENHAVRLVESLSADALEPCPDCFPEHYWVCLDSREYHSDIDCIQHGCVAPIRADLVHTMGYTPCAVCTGDFPFENAENVEYAIVTAEPTATPAPYVPNPAATPEPESPYVPDLSKTPEPENPHVPDFAATPEPESPYTPVPEIAYDP